MLRALHGGSTRDVLLHVVFAPPLIQQAPTRAARHGCNRQIVALKSSKGFGPPVSKSTKQMSKEQERLSNGTAADNNMEEVRKFVLDRTIKRIGVALGIPLVLSVLMFPLLWYLKSQLRLDVPEELPLQISGTLFAVLALGITFGIVFTSWDPIGDGSLLGSEEPNSESKVKGE